MNFYNYTSLCYSLVFFLLASVNILFAQSSTNVTGPIPPSAASMNFGKYADTPLNTNNGTTVVNIPLGSISDGPFSHTVSMSYHWGYFTGDLNRNTFDHNIPLSTYQGVSYGIGNRSSNSAWMDNGALKKVTYPTKGSTEYFYQANKAMISTPNSGSSPVNIFNTETCSDNYGACCGFKTVSHLQSSITQEMINTGSLEITTDYVAPCSSYGNSIPVDFLIKDNAGAIIFQESFNLTAPNNNLTYERTLFNVGVTTPGNYR